VKGLLWKGFAVAALLAGLLVPTASAKSPSVKIALLPLQKAQLGAAGKSLALEADSGAVSNARAAANSFTAQSVKTFKKMGRVTGYTLDYGVGSSGDSGVTEIRAEVDQYKTPADAKKGLAFWKKDDSWLAHLNQGGFAVANKPQSAPAVGSRRFAFLTSYSAANILPVSSVDEQFTDGKYELEVAVWAGSSSAATKLAPALAKKLDARLRAALKGTLHARSATLPGLPSAGPPPGGPDLTQLAVKNVFTGGREISQSEQYVPVSPAISLYDVLTQNSGSDFDLFDQEIFWYPKANEAAFSADWDQAAFLSFGGTPLDLTAVGDGAQGAIDNTSGGGFTEIDFSSGQLMESLTGISPQSVQASDVQRIAQSTADLINYWGLGS
jgi:hypothetical protein